MEWTNTWYYITVKGGKILNNYRFWDFIMMVVFPGVFLQKKPQTLPQHNPATAMFDGRIGFRMCSVCFLTLHLVWHVGQFSHCLTLACLKLKTIFLLLQLCTTLAFVFNLMYAKLWNSSRDVNTFAKHWRCRVKSGFWVCLCEIFGGKTFILRHSRRFICIEGFQKQKKMKSHLGLLAHLSIQRWSFEFWTAGQTVLKKRTKTTPCRNLCDGKSPLKLLLSGVSVIGKGVGGMLLENWRFFWFLWVSALESFPVESQNGLLSMHLSLFRVLCCKVFIWAGISDCQISGGGTKDH